MQKFSDAHIENDKILAPFLLAASFHGLLKFIGGFVDSGILYWQFSPKDTARDLVDSYYTKREPHIPARDLFEATETFWKQIAQTRNGGEYGKL